MSQQPLPQEIATNAEKIARVLRRRLSPKRLSGAARDAVMGAVINARRNPDLTALDADLDKAASSIEPSSSRCYAMSRLLLEAAWMIPPGSPLEDRLARYVRNLFLRCRADDANRFAMLREEFISSQRSSLPVVRRLVGDALIDEPVDELEVAILADKRQPHDVRCRICSRILWASESPYFVNLFDYCIEAIRQADREGRNSPAAISAWSLERQLKNRRSPDVLRHLLPKYVEHHRDLGVAGRLMQLLREYGDPLVTLLVPLFQDPNDARERPAIARLLAHIAQHTCNVRAVEALTTLLVESCDEGGHDLVESFMRAARGIAARDASAETIPVRHAFQEAIERFENTSDPVLRNIADELRPVLLSEGLTPDAIERFLRGELDKSESQQIRYCGLEGMNALVAAARDMNREARERQRAMDTLNRLRNPQLRDQISDVAWAVYCDDPDPNVRATAIRVVSERKRHLSEADRQRLLRDYDAATGLLRDTLDGVRSYLIPAGVLDTLPPPELGVT